MIHTHTHSHKHAGDWGGESRSDVAVRVGERNKECIRILQCFLTATAAAVQVDASDADAHEKQQQKQQQQKPRKLAILYGAYHISDLKSKIESTLNLSPVPSLSAGSSSTDVSSSVLAWTIPLPLSDKQPSSSTTTNSSSSSSSVTTSSSLSIQYENLPVLAAAALLYLALGTLDWLVLAKIILEIAVDSNHVFIHSGPGLLAAAVTEGSSDSSVTALAVVSFLLSYLFLYVQRHLQLLRTISVFGVQWDRGLFED